MHLMLMWVICVKIVGSGAGGNFVGYVDYSEYSGKQRRCGSLEILSARHGKAWDVHCQPSILKCFYHRKLSHEHPTILLAIDGRYPVSFQRRLASPGSRPRRTTIDPGATADRNLLFLRSQHAPRPGTTHDTCPATSTGDTCRGTSPGGKCTSTRKRFLFLGPSSTAGYPGHKSIVRAIPQRQSLPDRNPATHPVAQSDRHPSGRNTATDHSPGSRATFQHYATDTQG